MVKRFRALGVIGWACLALLAVGTMKGEASTATVPVWVDPGTFEGRWQGPDGVWHREPAEVLFPVDARSTIRVGARGAFTVLVDSAGNVTVENGVSASGGSGTVTFQTGIVHIHAGDFDGRVRLDWETPVFGDQTWDLVLGTAYQVGYDGRDGATSFEVLGDGSVVSHDTDKVTASANALTLVTVPVHFDLGTYEGLHFFIEFNQFGSRTYDVVPNTEYRMEIAAGHLNPVHFSMSTAGEAIVLAAPAGTVTASGSNLLFHTTDVLIDANGFHPSSYLHGFPGFPRDMGAVTVPMVTGCRYRWVISTAASDGSVYFTVDSSSTVTTDRTDAVTVSGSTMTANTVPMHVVTNGTVLPHTLYRGTWVLGDHTHYLVQGVSFSYHVGSIPYRGILVRGEVDGTVSVNDQPSVLVTGPNTVELQTADVLVEPDPAYTGDWRLHHLGVPYYQGPQTLTLVLGAGSTLEKRGGGLGPFQVLSPCGSRSNTSPPRGIDRAGLT